MRRSLLAAAVCLFASAADAATTVVDNFWYGFRTLPAAGGSTLNGASSTAATWFNAEWNNPSDYNAYTSFTCPSGWGNCFGAWSANEWTVLYTSGGTPHIILGERGNNIACSTELDNLAAPINSVTYPGYPVAVLSTPNLAAITNLYAKFTVTPLYDDNGIGAATCSSALTKGSMLFAVSLSSTGGQTLFYQLIIRTFNQPSFVPAWFANSNPFGYNDSMENYGGLRKGIPYFVATTFLQDLLPRLTAVITSASNGLDTTVADWKVASIYIGNLAYGNVTVESDWSNVFVYSVP